MSQAGSDQGTLCLLLCSKIKCIPICLQVILCGCQKLYARHTVHLLVRIALREADIDQMVIRCEKPSGAGQAKEGQSETRQPTERTESFWRMEMVIGLLEQRIRSLVFSWRMAGEPDSLAQARSKSQEGAACISKHVKAENPSGEFGRWTGLRGHGTFYYEITCHLNWAEARRAIKPRFDNKLVSSEAGDQRYPGQPPEWSIPNTRQGPTRLKRRFL